ncbi:MAG TPA: hypothetical protein VLG12_02035 [Candidatus Saccharimonadales bacterium]|nr:hypothetical protein [Candidatus Saccharimonadales bacterium]
MRGEPPYQLVAQLVNAVALPEDYHIIIGILNASDLKGSNTLEAIEAKQLLTKTLVRITYDMREKNPQDYRLLLIADFISLQVQKDIPNMDKDMAYTLELAQNSPEEDTPPLASEYTQRHIFGDPAWNIFYFEAVTHFQSVYWSNRRLPEEYLKIMETYRPEMEQKLSDRYYFEKLIDRVSSLYRYDYAAYKYADGYEILRKFGKTFIYENIERIETMMHHIDEPLSTKSLMETIESLYDTEESVENENVTNVLLKHLDFALQQESYGQYLYPMIKNIYVHATKEQIQQINILLTDYYRNHTTRVIPKLPFATILEYQNVEQREETKKIILTAYAERDAVITTAVTHEIMSLYNAGNADAREILIQVMQEYNLNFDDFITTWTESIQTKEALSLMEKKGITYAKALNICRSEHGKQFINGIMAEYGLHHDILLEAWKNSDDGHDTTWRQLPKMVDLETQAPGITRKLYRGFNIRGFSYGKEERLLQQHEQRTSKGPWELRLLAGYDYSLKRAWNAPFVHEKRAQEAEKAGLLHRTAEWDTEIDALNMVLRLAARYGAPEIIVLEGHSDADTMVGQDIFTTLSQMTKNQNTEIDGAITADNVRKFVKQYPNLLQNILKPETTIVLMGCGPMILARELAIATGCTVIASDNIMTAHEPTITIAKKEDAYIPIVDYGFGERDRQTGKRPKVGTIIYEGAKLRKEAGLLTEKTNLTQQTPITVFPGNRNIEGIA